MAWLPPAVFSMSSGTVMSVCATALRQLSKPFSSSSSEPTWPPWTIRPLAPTSAATSICCWRSLRLGMRMRLFSVATLRTYGAWT